MLCVIKCEGTYTYLFYNKNMISITRTVPDLWFFLLFHFLTPPQLPGDLNASETDSPHDRQGSRQ